jgi:hypothetical protein
LLALGLVVSGCTLLGGKDRNKLKSETVQDLTVEDIPDDGGDGLIVSWKPLPREKRVLEYRIYRGLSPDTLFFLASVQVNVKTGVASDMMHYYDSGSSDFIDINSPGKLRYEKQNKGGIIYRGIPRDEKLAARLARGFDLYSSMESKDYYYHSTKSRSANQDDESVYAGMKFRHQTIYASLKTNKTYYYTVVPVNERNIFMGVADPKSGVPVDNPPEPAPALYSTILEDAREIRFEWEYPLNKSDINQYRIYLLSPRPDSLWEKEKSDPAAWQAGAVPLTQGLVGGGVLPNYTKVDLNPLLEEGLDWQRITGSRYAIEFIDGVGTALSPQSTPVVSFAKDLPAKAEYVVEDKINDKGDRLSVVWDNPIVFITKTSSLNKDNTRLKINYQLNKTDVQKVKNLYFEFFTAGADKPFITINEFHQDNIVKLRLPNGYDYKQGLKVRMKMSVYPYQINPKTGRANYGKARLVEGYALSQNLNWDAQMMALMPSSELYRDGTEISDIQNIVYRKSFRSPYFTLVKRNTSYDNNLDVTIPYVASVGKPVEGFNYVENGKLYTYSAANDSLYSRPLAKGEKARNVTLVSSELDMIYSPEEKTTLYTSIYLDEAKKYVSGLKDKLGKKQDELKAKEQELAGLAPASPEAAALQTAIAGLTRETEALDQKIKLYAENADFTKSLKFRGNRSRMKFVASLREPESRKQSYMIVRSNGRGFYTESDPDTLAGGAYNYYTPISNWFDWNKLITLFAVIIFGGAVVVFVNLAKRGRDLYMRPIAGLQEIDNAIGRATEMGRPMLYCMGNGGLSDVATLASMGILGLVARKAAEYDTKLIVPCYDYIVMPIAQEIVREAHYAVGRPDSYDKNNIFFLTNAQFAYVAGVNGIMIRERMATNFFMGYFAAEALLMTETGNAVGAVQIAGSDAITQIPFFITTCDYTLIGEELYAASAYLNREPMLLGTLKAQDYFKFLILVFVIAGAVLASFQATGLMQLFPIK